MGGISDVAANVLIVSPHLDLSAGLATLVQEMYRDGTVRVIAANLLAAYEQSPAALVILDESLEDSYRLCAELKNRAAAPHVLMLIGPEAELSQLQAARADDYARKPIHPAVLQWRIERLIHRDAAPSSHPNVESAGNDFTFQNRAENPERSQRALAEALRDTAAALARTLDLEVLMNGILETVGRVVPHDAANIMRIDGTIVRVTHMRGYDVAAEARLRERHLSLEFPYLRQMMKTGQPRLIQDVRQDPNWIEVAETAWIRSSIATPIQAHGQVIGFLHLDSATPNQFTRQDMEYLEAFANQAAIAIENAQLYDEIRRSNIELERRVAERTAELHRAKERAEAILNHDRDSILVLDSDGVICQANQAFDDWLGGSGEGTFGRTLFGIADEKSRELLNRVFQDVILNNRPRRVEIVARTIHGDHVDADVMLSPIANDEQRVQSVVCSLRDISDHKRMEIELRHSLKKERDLNAFQARFISEMSHEFRTPLAKILTSRDILKMYSDRLTDEQKNERLDQIQREVKAMVTLLDNLLAETQSDTSKELG